MFNKVKKFFADPENQAIIKSAVISTAVCVVITAAANVAALGVAVVFQAVSNAIENSSEKEEE